MVTEEYEKEASIEHRESINSSRTRRGFLRHVAATGVAGTMSLALATRPASASSRTATVYGRADGTTYRIYSTGDIDRAAKAEDDVSNPGYDSDHGEHIRGRINDGKEDSFTYTYAINEVRINGHAHVYMPDTTGSRIQVYGLSGWTSYQISAEYDIDRWSDTERGDSNPGRDTDHGKYVTGNVKKGGYDYYTKSGDVQMIGINGHATITMYL